MSVAFVQGTGAQSSGSVASLSVAFAGNVTAGNAIAAGMVCNNNTILTTSVTDSLSNSYSQTSLQNGVAAGNAESAGFYAKNISGGACTVTFDPSGSDFVSGVIAEFSGVDTSAPLDGTGGVTTSGPTVTTSTFTMAGNGVVFGIMEQNQLTTTLTPGGGATQIAENENVTNAMPFNGTYLLTTAGAGKSATWTMGTTRKATAVAFGLKESTGGPTFNPGWAYGATRSVIGSGVF